MRFPIAIGILLALSGCATSGESGSRLESNWQRADGSATDLEQLEADRFQCLNRAGVPSPGSQSPMQATRNEMIDCMRMKGWLKR